MSNLKLEASAIVEIMEKYIEDFLEKPHPVFADMPVCPFARKVRINKKIYYAVYPFQVPFDPKIDPYLADLILAFKYYESHDILMVIHPNKEAFTFEKMKEFIKKLNIFVQPLGLKAFSAHPFDDFNIKSVFTRRDPFINFVIQRITTVKEASKILKNTNYYDNWSAENLNAVNLWDP